MVHRRVDSIAEILEHFGSSTYSGFFILFIENPVVNVCEK